MVLSVFKKIVEGLSDEEFGDYTLVRHPNSTIIEGVRIDEKLKVIYI